MTGLLLIDLQKWFFRTEERFAALPKLLQECNRLSTEFRNRSLPVFHIRTELPAHDRSVWPLSLQNDDQGVLIEGTSDVEYCEAESSSAMGNVSSIHFEVDDGR